ncbi:UNVERIFIED_CONTAM: Glycine-rich RNA-binding protein RZ1C [Sesamum radiatum]|uniref:Glycine-rich RNA-binding protein RZ1C n=1 Tax=Sesamum radiatum TaxID=300843 RepID=A0AAW2TFN9_SESRA
MLERDTGRPRGFGFLTFADRRAMEDAIRDMHGREFGERVISVNKAQPKMGGDDPGHGYGSYSSGGRGGYGGDRSARQDDCFKCGRPGHWARDCPSAGAGRGARPFSTPRARYVGTGGRGDRHADYRDRYVDDRYDRGRYGDRDRYDIRDDRYGSRDRYMNDRYPQLETAFLADSEYDQTTLNLLSFVKDLGSNVGVLFGLINEVTSLWVVLSIGVLLNFFGYFMIWLAISKKILRPHVWPMCLYIFTGANSQSFANTGALVTIVKNFPGESGRHFRLLKGRIVRVLANDTDNEAVRVSHELKVFYRFLYVSLRLAGFLMSTLILQKRVSFTRSELGFSAAIILFLLFLPVAIVVKEEIHLWGREREDHNLGNFSQLKI